MQLQILRVKIQELIVSESSITYPGSIGLPDDIIKGGGLKLFEQVYVNNATNGNRIMTYLVRSKKPGIVTVNGAASKLFKAGDKIHVLAFGYFDEEEAERFQPIIIHADAENKLIDVVPYTL